MSGPTTDELNAGFDAATKTLLVLINTVVPDHNIPFVGNLRQIALEKIQSAEGRKMVLDEVRQILAAAQAVREKAAAKPTGA